MKKIMMSLMAVIMGLNTVSADNEKGISVSQLPKTAQTFLTKHFKNAKIAMVTSELDWMGKEYNVIFADGSKIEFDKSGNWENIDCGRNSVPEAVIPASIAKYVKDTFTGSKIVEIDVDKRDYEVELSNGAEIVFDKKFNVVGMSD